VTDEGGSGLLDRARRITLFDVVLLKVIKERGGVARNQEILDELVKYFNVRNSSSVSAAVHKLSGYRLVDIVKKGVYKITPEGEKILQFIEEVL
jgi:Mn-dependent DtxR family transcriptional regulator